MKKLLTVIITILTIALGTAGCKNINTNKNINKAGAVEKYEKEQVKTDKIQTDNEERKSITKSETKSKISNNKEVKEKQNLHNTHKVLDSGLLLGLKKCSEDNKELCEEEVCEYETIWIGQNGDKLNVIRKKGLITVPYKTGFYKMENQHFEDKKLNELADPTLDPESEDLSLYYYEYKLDYTDIVSSKLKESPKALHDKTEGEKLIDTWPILSRDEQIIFAGNNYALIRGRGYETGGGTFAASYYNTRLYDIKDIGNIDKAEDIKKFLPSNIQTTIDSLKKEYNKKPEEDKITELRNDIDGDNISLMRKNGHWTAAVPLKKIYVHNGNGSCHERIEEYKELTSDVPKDLICFDKLCIPFDKIKDQIKDARDAVSSPNGGMLAVLVNNELKIYLNPKEELGEEDYSIPIDKNQSIILNQWSEGKYVKTWSNELSILNK
jgi:hypothetical protein